MELKVQARISKKSRLNFNKHPFKLLQENLIEPYSGDTKRDKKF